MIVALASSLQVKQRTRWRRVTVAVEMDVGGTVRRVRVGAHTDLEVMIEVLVRREYDDLPCADAEVIVDLGAHIGLATLRLLAANPSARVIAVEPDPFLIEQLRANVSGLPVTVLQAAISDESGERTFYRSDTFSWANSLERTMPVQIPVSVHTVTLDEILDAYSCSRVDLLKVDIEGGEWDLFSRGLPDRVQSVVGEVHARPGRAPKQLIDGLTADGLTVEIGRADSSVLTFRAVRNPSS
jgi:FkbM family methyltransferase